MTGRQEVEGDRCHRIRTRTYHRVRNLTLGLTVVALLLSGCSSDSTSGLSVDSGAPVTSGTAPSAGTAPSTPFEVTTSAPTSMTPATSTSPIATSPSSSAPTLISTPASVPQPLDPVGLPGTNELGCRGSGPPVVLLHGTLSTPAANFRDLGAALQEDDRCVYAPLFGEVLGYGGIGRIEDSAALVTAFIDKVGAQEGVDQVDVVAFSQGALVLRTALQRDLDPADIRLAVFLAPSYHGTTVALASKVPAAACPACAEQVVGSALLQELAAGGELAPGALRYATLSIQDDAWVRPVADQSPVGPADRVRQQILQDACPDVRVEHSSLPSAPAAISWTRAALDTGGRPPTTFPCR